MTDVVPNAGVIALGKQGENRAVRVTLPNIRAGAGSILLLHQRSDDQKPYPVPVVEADGGIIWTVSSTDTAYPGRGQAELQWLGVNGEVAKSVTYQTNTTRSMAEPGAVPDEPLKPYTQAVARDAQAAKDAAASATEAARSAGASATQAGISADNAAKTLTKLEDGIASGDFRGEKGEQGEKGEKGDPGPQGPQGEVGPAGDTTSADAAAEAAREAAQKAQKAAETAVLYTEQNLTDSQQEQARTNINAADKARQNILLGTEIGNPIAVDDAFSAPLCGLTVYGKSTQGGTPTPDAPVPIVSAGDSGNVAVKVTGKNLFYEQGFQGYFINSAANSVGLAVGNVSSVLQVVTGAKYYVTRNKIGTKFRVAVVDELPTKSSVVRPSSAINADSKRQVEISATSKYMVIQCEDEAAFSELMVSLDSSTAYSTYREQLLTLPTPNGLPGIPVPSGGNYTDQNGQQWVCDEVDLERGVRVQRVKVKELSPDVKWTYYKLSSGNNNFQTLIYGEDASKNSFPSICNILPFKNVIWNDSIQNLPKIYANDQEITVSFPPNSEFSSLEVFKQLLTNVKSIIYYCLATPIETPLTPSEIAAYKALITYAPDTVVQASDGAGLKLDYQRDVNIVIKNLEDAIASMTTT